MTARDDQGNGLHSGRDRRGRVYWAWSHGLTGAASVSNPGVQAGAGPAGTDEATPPLYPQWRHSAWLPAPRDGPTTIRPGERPGSSPPRRTLPSFITPTELIHGCNRRCRPGHPGRRNRRPLAAEPAATARLQLHPAGAQGPWRDRKSVV